jgi:ABC-type antimicrobial peptide transport system permease subunit
MKLNDFKIGWRLLISEPAYSLIVILGLSLGFAASFTLLSYVSYSLQYNSNVKDVENVFVVKQRYNVDPVSPWFDQSPYFLRNVAIKFPGVISASGYVPNTTVPVKINNQLRKLNVLPVLPEFTHLLGIEAVEGNLDDALEQPENIIMTQQTAERYFGTSHAIGLTLQASGLTLRVAAILPNLPSNTTISYEAIVGAKSLLISEKQKQEMLAENGNGTQWGKLLIRIKSGTSVKELTEELQRAVDNSSFAQNQKSDVKQRLGNRKVLEVKLSSLANAYFDQEIAENPITMPGDRGNPVIVASFSAIAVLIMVLAAINYVNLATVRLLHRQREIGMRKTFGATATQIFTQFLSESFLMSWVATGLGLLLAWLFLPIFSDLMQRKLENMFSINNIFYAIAIGTIIGILTTIYPAWTALRVRPLEVLIGRQNTESARGNLMRRIMTVLQIAVAIGLTSVTLAIAWQTNFAMNVSPGFDPEPLLIIDLPVQVKGNEKANNFITALTQQKNIDSVAITNDAVGRSKSRFGLDFTRENYPNVFLEMKSVSANFFDQYRIQPVAGRLFDKKIDKEDDPESIIINTIAVQKFGFETPAKSIGQSLKYTNYDGSISVKRIIGVAPEIRFFSLHEKQRAIAWELWTQSSTLSVRTNGDVADAKRIVRQMWQEFYADNILEMYSAKSILTGNYDEDTRLMKLLIASTAIAIAISSFGIYALSAYSVQRKAREIVLRKLYGATKKNIAQLILREISLLILFAAAIGLPLSTIVIQLYLTKFVEHAPIGYWTLFISLMIAFAITVCAAMRHIFLAMNMKPVKILTN